MSTRKLCLAALLLFWAASGPVHGDLLTLDACEEALDAWLLELAELEGGDAPPFALAAACPELNDEVLAHPLHPLLEPAGETLSLDAARALLAIGDFYALVERGAPLSDASLPGIMEELTEPPRTLSWYERLQAWIERQLFDEETPLGDWARNVEISENILDTTLAITVTLLVAAAVALVGYEIFLARRHGRSPGPEGWASPARRTRAALSMDEVRAAPAREQLSLLLALVLGRLEGRGVLERGAQLTHRQVAHEAASNEALAAIREPLGAISAGAEHERYGADPVAPAARTDLLAQGEALVASLTEPERVRRRRR